MGKPRIFIGSSTEGLPIARAVQSNLYGDAELVVWENDVFQLSAGTLESIWNDLAKYDYGIFVLTQDDMVASREVNYLAPRDNVILELGIFIGRLGKERTFWITPKVGTLKMPTDLLGVISATYDPSYGASISAMLGPACEQIRQAISNFQSHRTLTWQEVTNGAFALAQSLKKSPSLGGFPSDVIIGLSGGGSIVADLIAKSYGGVIPSTTLCVNRRRHPVEFYSGIQDIKWMNNLTLPGQTLNILLVDDISRTGTTISCALDFIKNEFPDSIIKTASLAARVGGIFKPDYCAITLNDDDVRTPFQI